MTQASNAKGLVAAAALAIVSAAVSMSSAAACSPPPPPNWAGWIGDQNISMFLGRVERVDAAEAGPEATVIWGVAHIVPLETIQGQPAGEPVEDVGALEVRAPAEAAGAGCLKFLQHHVGDLVVVVETPFSSRREVYGAGWIRQPYFAPFFERHQ